MARFSNMGTGTRYRFQDTTGSYTGGKSRPGSQYDWPVGNPPGDYVPSGQDNYPGTWQGGGPMPRSAPSKSMRRQYWERFFKQLGKNLGPYGALANLDPEGTRRHARAANAYLEQFMPDWWYRPGWWNYMGWSTQSSVGRSAYAPAMGGWTRCPTPNLGCEATWGAPTHQVTQVNGAACAVFGSCPTNQAYPNNSDAAGAPVAPNIGRIWFFKQTGGGAPNPNLGTIVTNWWRAVPGNTASPWQVGTIVLPTPVGDPWADPWPATQMAVSYGPKQGSGLALKPYQRPVDQTVTIGGGGVVPRPPPGSPPGSVPGVPGGPPHNQLPPPAGTKEKKAKANYGSAGRAYGAVTEAQDFSDCLVKGIKAGAKAEGVRLGPAPGRWNLNRIAWIAKNAGHIDMKTFVECVAVQQVTDDLMGAASSNIDRRFREKGYLTGPRGINGGRPSGFSTGPHQQAIQRALNEARMR